MTFDFIIYPMAFLCLVAFSIFLQFKSRFGLVKRAAKALNTLLLIIAATVAVVYAAIACKSTPATLIMLAVYAFLALAIPLKFLRSICRYIRI